jgi:DNA mismatch repair protein MutS2
MLITGPNTGGKTVTLKMLGLYALLMSCGIFPPAEEIRYGPFTGVYADIGDEQSVQQSLSTFSGHLRNIATIFRAAKPGGLALFDEIGAGTDPKEGAAIGRAILTRLTAMGVTIAASTHYGELKSFAQESDGFTCAAMEFDLATLRPTYKLIPGASGRSHAFEISRKYGLPEEVVDLAESSIGSEAADERSKSETLDHLIAQARQDRESARELQDAAREVRESAVRERDEQLEKLRKLRARMEEEVVEAIRGARESYRELLEIAKSAPASERESLIHAAKEIADVLDTQRVSLREPVGAAAAAEFSPGMNVRLLSNGQTATILEVRKSGNLLLQIGAMKMSVASSDVEPAKLKPSETRASSSRRISIEKTLNAKSELHLRKLRAEDAIETLDRFFDEAVLSGLHTVRIVHGKGEGILRKVVQDFLRSRKDVHTFAEADATQGGAGVTVVHFK